MSRQDVTGLGHGHPGDYRSAEHRLLFLVLNCLTEGRTGSERRAAEGHGEAGLSAPPCCSLSEPVGSSAGTQAS